MQVLKLFWIFLCFIEDINGLDQCKTTNYLSRDVERSKDNNAGTSCDTGANGWYRFRSGEIATSCVPREHCGTTSTIWMKDPVPNIGETRLNEFCVNHGTSHDPNPCCKFSQFVNVTNCDGFLVYDFNGNYLLCPSGYCSANMRKCPSGERSATGFEPCTAVRYPLMHGPPVLHPPTITHTGQDFTQVCSVDYNGTDTDAAFNVTWLFDGVPYKTQTLSGGATSTSLHSMDWTGHVGEKLSCTVVSYRQPEGPQEHSKTLTSNEFYGAIFLDTKATPVNISEVAQAVSLVSTLPIVCPNIFTDLCRVDFNIDVIQGNPDHIFFENGCTPSLHYRDWNRNRHRSEVKVHISTLIEPVERPEQEFSIKFHIRSDSLTPDWLKPLSDPHLMVKSEGLSHHYCMITGAAEFYGFRDNKLNQPRVIKIGPFESDFVAYSANNSFGRTVELQVRTWKPVGLAAVCGVAFRHGDTLIKVDMCSSRNVTVPVLTQGKNNADDVIIYLCGSVYEIVTGDGVRVSIAIQSDHLDTKLHLSPGYPAESSGLCNYTGWRQDVNLKEIPVDSAFPTTSFFDKGLLPFERPNSNVLLPHFYCNCGGKDTKCSPFRALADPAAPISFDMEGKMRTRDECTPVVPHSMNPDITPRNFLLNTGTKPAGFQPKITQCTNAIRTHASAFCIRHHQSSIAAFAQLCSKDSFLSGDYDNIVPSVVQTFSWYCQESTLGSSSNYQHSSRGLIPPPEVTSDTCYGLCSLHGTCHHGICGCVKGYHGFDCSIASNSKPLILGIKGGESCGLSSDHCFKPILITRNIQPTANLAVQVNVSNMLPHNHQVLNLEAIYDNKYGISLPMEHVVDSLGLQDRTTLLFTMRVTNDLTVFSDPIKYFVFDDRCEQCNGFNCLLKEDSCRIIGRCFVKGDVNPDNNTQMCDPNIALMTWTDVSNSHPTKATTNKNFVVIG